MIFVISKPELTCYFCLCLSLRLFFEMQCNKIDADVIAPNNETGF